MELDHVANRLHLRHFETVADVLKAKLGSVELRRTERSIWPRQPGDERGPVIQPARTIHRDGDKYPFAGFVPARDFRKSFGRSGGLGAGAPMETVVGSYSPAAVRIFASSDRGASSAL